MMKRNKPKFLLSTRNNFTGKAINNVDSASIKELLNGKSSYMNWENNYLRRRFHGNDLSDSQVQRFNKFCKIHNGDKPLLILDVDNTMLYVRFFSDEMRINDIVTYFGYSHFKHNASVLKLQKTLHLEIINGQLIDKLGKEQTRISLWIDDNDILQEYKKGATYDYKPDDLSYTVQCKILKTEVTGCIIAVRNDEFIEEQSEEYEYSQTQSIQQIEISFVDENEHLNKLEPTLNRPGMLPVDFIYGGFLVRLRPNLDEFLEYASDDFDIAIFTAATKAVYNGMLSVLHEYIKDQLGRDDEHDLKLWTDILFRDDCTLKNEKRLKPYHHKDLTLFGCHLSRTVMIDNSPIVVSGQEPNVILIQDFFGKDQVDDEFMEVYTLLDAIKDIKGDIRYFLCDIDSPNNDDEKLDFSTEESCKQITTEFINTLKKEFKHNKRISVSISQSAKRYSLSADNVPTPPLKTDSNTAPHSYAAGVPHPTLVKGSSTPIYSVWMDKFEKRKELLRAKFQKKHKSLLMIGGFGKLAVKRHTLYSSMRPKIEDNKNFDIRASVDSLEDVDDIMHMNIMEHPEINDHDFDSKFDFDGMMDDDDITDDEDEYLLINPSPIIKPKNKNMQVKFTNMTSLEIREINEISENEQNDPTSPMKSDMKPLRIEFATVDDDDEKILLKPEDQQINHPQKYMNDYHDLDEEKINISNVSVVDKVSKDSITKALLNDNTNNNNDMGMENKEIKTDKNNNENKKKGRIKPRLEKDLDEQNGFCTVWRLFCL